MKITHGKYNMTPPLSLSFIYILYIEQCNKCTLVDSWGYTLVDSILVRVCVISVSFTECLSSYDRRERECIERCSGELLLWIIVT